MSDKTRQMFDTADVLRLEVERDPEADELRNLVENTDGALGAWGWTTPQLGTAIVGGPSGFTFGEQWLKFLTSPDQNNFYWTENLPVTPGSYVIASYASHDDGMGLYTRGRLRLLDFNGDVLDSTPVTGWQKAGDESPHELDRIAVPNDAFYVRLDINVARNDSGDDIAAWGRYLLVNDVKIIEADFEHRDELAHPLPDVPSHYMPDVIDLASSITINRAPLDAGTMTVTLIADALSANEIDGYGEGPYGLTYYGGAVEFDGSSLRPGKNVTLTALVSTTGIAKRLFTGEVLSGRVDYDLTQPEGKRAKITLNCVDPAARLAAKRHKNGYSDVNDVAALLEGCGVPWNILFGTGTDPVTSTDCVDPSATVLDQVLRTRDSNPDHLFWIDVDGVFMVRKFDNYIDRPGPFVLTDRHYNGSLVVNYDTEAAINSVSVTALNGTDSDEFGPFDRPYSISRWGWRTASYTVISDGPWDASDARAYAARILDANAEPALRVESATLPILEQSNPFGEPAAYAFGSMWWATLDLYDRVKVTNDAPQFEYDLDVTSVSHQITPKKWLTTVGFGLPGRAAKPTVPIR